MLLERMKDLDKAKLMVGEASHEVQEEAAKSARGNATPLVRYVQALDAYIESLQACLVELEKKTARLDSKP